MNGEKLITKLKTIGKMLDEKFTLEGLFAIVLSSKKEWNKREKKIYHKPIRTNIKSILKIHRDLDVIGIYTLNNISIPLIILPMTDMIGALFVKRRLDLVMPTIEFIVDGIAVHIEPKVTVSGPNKKLTPDKDSYLEALYELHSRPILQ